MYEQLLIIDNAVVVVLVAINRETQGTGTYVIVSFAYVNMREGLSVVSLYWRSNNKREIQKHCFCTCCHK